MKYSFYKFSHIIGILNSYKDSFILIAKKDPSLEDEEKERQGLLLQCLISDIILDQINELGFKKIN